MFLVFVLICAKGLGLREAGRVPENKWKGKSGWSKELDRNASKSQTDTAGSCGSSLKRVQEDVEAVDALACLIVCLSMIKGGRGGHSSAPRSTAAVLGASTLCPDASMSFLLLHASPCFAQE